MNDAGRSTFFRAQDGLRLHAIERGQRAGRALPVVCLPGLTRTAGDFDRLADALSADPAARRVVVLESRGRGLSERDPDWRNYDLRVELADLTAALDALGVGEAAFVGTSRGGLLTMLLSAARPACIRGAVLNDIGPVIEGRGLARLKASLAQLPSPASLPEGEALLRRLNGALFPDADDASWARAARRTWREEGGRLVPTHDPAILKPLLALDLETPQPDLWPYFEGLSGVPVLSIRGGLSDLFGEATQAEMARRHPAFEALVVPREGHAPLLEDDATIGAIARLVERAEALRPSL